MLTTADLYQLFANNRGIQDVSIHFDTVSIFDNGDLKKGLFVPIDNEHRLDKAIESGAIAAIWPSEKEVPFFTPNHFPIFLVENPISAFKQLCDHYIYKIKQEECEKMTKFVFFSPELLKNHPQTYDLSEKGTGQQLLETINNFMNKDGRG
ncbi:hypothetical protein [Bacillus sp. FJAT-49736]|uniref:hypothetical protein n=1 Tax=Bacillus sp. FJAT-49736 TaxID=2833582 RepID=UPI001BC9AA26|nr:hypothetical protein [Bacillus sp. FJAT-49736]MBS4172423.1 hypothetical protein [Bacillus sp. FJAT-49736]